MDGKYNTFTCWVGLPGNDFATGLSGEIGLYADGKTIWEDLNINGASDTVELKLDVTGVKELRPCMCGDLYGLNAVKVMIADGVLQKTEK